MKSRPFSFISRHHHFTSRRQYLTVVAALLFSFLFTSCGALKDIQRAIGNLSRCEFKLASIDNFSLMNVNLGAKNNISDFSITEGIRLVDAFGKGKLPTSFTLNVAAINPNDGSGGTAQTSATLTSFAWTLILDDRTTIKGNIAEPITIPGTGQSTIIPLRMDLDLFEFFEDKGYESIINLAMALGGVKGSPTKVTLRARPTIRTAFGDITYPGDIDIIDREFRAE